MRVCTQTMRPIYNIFNVKHDISDMNNIYINFNTFEEYLQELEPALTDGQTDLYKLNELILFNIVGRS